MDDGTIRTLGDFSIYVWAATISITDSSGSRDYESGVESGSPAPTGASYAWLQTQRLLRLEVTGGDLTLMVQKRVANWAAQSLTVSGDFSSSWTNASGQIRTPKQDLLVRNETLSMGGNGTIEAWNATVVGIPRIASRLQLNQATAEVRVDVPIVTQGIPVMGDPRVPTPPSPSSDGRTWWWTIPALLLTGVGAFVAVRIAAPNATIDTVEYAIFTHRPARAERLARRILRKKPNDVDVLFLFGSAMLARHRYTRILEEIEPLASKVPPRVRVGVAFVLAVAAEATGDKEKALRWGRECRREPQLLAHLSGSTFDPLRATAPVAVGYA